MPLLPPLPQPGATVIKSGGEEAISLSYHCLSNAFWKVTHHRSLFRGWHKCTLRLGSHWCNSASHVLSAHVSPLVWATVPPETQGKVSYTVSGITARFPGYVCDFQWLTAPARIQHIFLFVWLRLWAQVLTPSPICSAVGKLGAERGLFNTSGVRAE